MTNPSKTRHKSLGLEPFSRENTRNEPKSRAIIRY